MSASSDPRSVNAAANTLPSALPGTAGAPYHVVPVGYGVCSVPGCCGDRPLRRPWTYTVGLVERGLPELVLFGLDHVCAHHALSRIAELSTSTQLALNTTFELDGVQVMLVDVPRQWLMLDTGRMAVWFEDYPRRPDPSVVQLVWSDVDGRFPDDPLCDPLVTCSQPMLRDDPRRHPRPPDLRSRHRSRRPGRR